MTDAEWIALPVDLRMWAVDAAIRAQPMTFEAIEQDARALAAVVMRAPPPESPEPAYETTATWRSERGLG